MHNDDIELSSLFSKYKTQLFINKFPGPSGRCTLYCIQNQGLSEMRTHFNRDYLLARALK